MILDLSGWVLNITACVPIRARQRKVIWKNTKLFSEPQLILIIFLSPLSILSSHLQLSLLEGLVVYLCDTGIYNKYILVFLWNRVPKNPWNFLKDKRDKEERSIFVIQNKPFSTSEFMLMKRL